MRTVLGGLLVLAALLPACGEPSAPPVPPATGPAAVPAEPVELTFDVHGMQGECCPAMVKHMLEQVDGVIGAEVDLETQCARVRVRPGTPVERIVAGVTKGYSVTPRPPVEGGGS